MPFSRRSPKSRGEFCFYENGLPFGGSQAPALQTLLPRLVRGLQREEGDGCYASYPSSVTFGASFPQGGSLGTRDPVHINFQNSLLSLLKAAHIKKPSPLGEGGRGSARMRGSRAAA